MFNFKEVAITAAESVNNSREMNSFIENNFGYQNYDSGNISVVGSVIEIDKEINYEVDESELDDYINDVDVSLIEEALRDNDENKALEEAGNVFDEVWELLVNGERSKTDKLADKVVEMFRERIGSSEVEFYTGAEISGTFEEFYPEYQVEGHIGVYFENNAFRGSENTYIVRYVENNMSEEVNEL